MNLARQSDGDDEVTAEHDNPTGTGDDSSTGDDNLQGNGDDTPVGDAVIHCITKLGTPAVDDITQVACVSRNSVRLQL